VTKKEAEVALAARKAAIANGQFVKDDDMRLSELFERFMEFKTASGRLEQTTLTRYKSIFDNHLGPAFGRMKAKELKQGHLVSQYARWFRDGINGRKISGRTIHHTHQTLRNALNWAVRTEIIPRNVATLVSTDDMPKVVKPKPKALKKDELDKLLRRPRIPHVARSSGAT
jgi:site-specific recombinase XerD